MVEGTFQHTDRIQPIPWPWAMDSENTLVRMPESMRQSEPVTHAMRTGSELYWTFFPDTRVWCFGPAGILMDFQLG